MSLTSSELNYLIWRYLQESGHELAAYALDKTSLCLAYEESPTSSASQVNPGCLVDLVQRGILYTMTEANVPGNDVSDALLSLLGALQHRQKTKPETENGLASTADNRFLLRAEVKDEEDTEMKDSVDTENGAVEEHLENAASSSSGAAGSASNATSEESVTTQDTAIEIPFTTKPIIPAASFPASICSSWRPGSEMLAYGQENSQAVIGSYRNGEISESVRLNHSSTINGNNEINIVSWSPQGNILVTCGTLGDLRAWSPDGKLRNLAINTVDENANGDGIQNGDAANTNTASATTKQLKVISSLIWNDNGHYLLTVDVNGEVCLRDGTNLNVIHHLSNTSSSAVNVDVCWLDETKFSVSTSKNTIRIFGITSTQSSIFGTPQIDVSPIGLLNGHENNVSIMKFNSTSKLLASCSDYDYAIKVWSSHSSAEPTVLNHNGSSSLLEPKLILHNTPVVELVWLDSRHLLSVLMDGVLNIWDVTTATAIISSRLFSTDGNYEKEAESRLKLELTSNADQETPHDILAFTASVSRNTKWLAVGDSLGRVSVWDIALDHYFSTVENAGVRNTVHCVGIYEFEIPKAENSEVASVGVCDLQWDAASTRLSASYMGASSLVFDVEAVESE